MRHRLLLASLALLASLILAACGGGVSDSQARKIAATWFSDAEKAAGEVVREVKTGEPLRADMNGVAGWEVKVSGTQDSTGALKVVYLFIDSATGEVTKMAEGTE